MGTWYVLNVALYEYVHFILPESLEDTYHYYPDFSERSKC